jgi:hypothetical protein|tara:strand:+ start:1419 stop:1664 length:246 start_codon:yes stop_codon:yes gene_type:complete
LNYAYLDKKNKSGGLKMRSDLRVHAIAVLSVDGENYEIDGCYKGKQRKPQWYNVVKSSNPKIHIDRLGEFPSHDKIRQLIN